MIIIVVVLMFVVDIGVGGVGLVRVKTEEPPIRNP